MSTLRIAIIGGSIAGCAAAIPLLRAGHEVSIFERSRKPLDDRGAGIVIPTPLFKLLQQLDMVGHEMAQVPLVGMHYVIRSDDNPQQGRAIWHRPLEGAALHWGELFRQLRQRIDDKHYQQGITVTAITQADRQVSLQLDNGNHFTADLVIAADGIHSLGRKLVSPASQINYAGYVLWRGLLPEAEVADRHALDGVLWNPYQGGLAGSYFIAGPNGNTKHGERLLNWGVYDLIDQATLQQLVPEFDIQHPAQPHQLNEKAKAHLHTLAAQRLPQQTANIIAKTPSPFLQPIVDIAATCLVRQRVILIGDAGAVLRPHTASGAVKAMQNALSLAKTLAEHDVIDEALCQWEAAQLTELTQQVALSKSLGKGWITAAPDWEKMEEADLDDWWKSMVSGADWYLNKKD